MVPAFSLIAAAVLYRLLYALAGSPATWTNFSPLASIFLETATGKPVEVNGTMAAPGYPARPPDRMEIVGSSASVAFDDWELRLLGPSPRTERYDRDAGYQASFDGVIAHFVHCLASGSAFETGPTDSLETLRLVEDAYAAAGLPHRQR